MSICQSAIYQAGYAQSMNSLSSEEFLKKFSQYEKFSSLKTNFIQRKTIPSLNVTLEAEGTLTVKRPDTVIWEIIKPGEMTVKLDKNTLSIVSGKGEAHEVENLSLEKVPAKISEKLLVMKLWLNFNPEGLYQNYTVFEVKPDQFKLIPKKSPGTGFSSFEIQLHKDGFMKRLVLQEESGDLLDYTFTKPQLNRNHLNN